MFYIQIWVLDIFRQLSSAIVSLIFFFFIYIFCLFFCSLPLFPFYLSCCYVFKSSSSHSYPLNDDCRFLMKLISFLSVLFSGPGEVALSGMVIFYC